MRIVSVSGACSGAGKTALLETLLRALPGPAAAVKFTTTEDVFERCPRGSSCVVCDIDVPYRVIADPKVLREPGTDTDRLSAAGARPVLWAIARESAAAPAWDAVTRLLPPDALVVLEGSSVVERGLARPDLRLFVAHRKVPPERWKPTSASLIAAADRVVVHAPDGSRPAAAVVEGIEARGGAGRWVAADVTTPLCGWAPDLAARVAALASAPDAVVASR
jgi:molybdopterin-guanine dinucleotide biosynthesis protein